MSHWWSTLLKKLKGVHQNNDKICPNLGHKKGGRSHGTPPWGVLRWHGYADFIVEKGKGLFSHENKPFYTPFGGDKRDRTADLLNAIQALSQLSYTPRYFRLWKFSGCVIFNCRFVVARWGHTFNWLGSQLSYTPILRVRWVFLIQFWRGGGYTIVSGSQLSYTPEPEQLIV